MASIQDQELVVYDLTSSKDQGSALGEAVVTYEKTDSGYEIADPDHPFLTLSDPDHLLADHQNGDFLNPNRRTAFEFRLDGEMKTVDIKRIDSRFIRLLDWLGGERRPIRLHGVRHGEEYCVYGIRMVDPSGRTVLRTAEDSLLQLMIERLLSGHFQEEEEEDGAPDETVRITTIPDIENYLFVAGSTMPKNVLKWARRNLETAKSNSISPEERRHALRALSMMLNIKWKGSYFESIDPVKAREILDAELYGMESVKQRIIETVIQINRTHTLPAYGILLAGPAGIGKSQVAYAVAKILRLPWISLDMSTIHDAEALTGSPRVYANAKPGRIMEGFAQAATSNLVFIINELDKADVSSPNGNPADALLTLLDNLGFTDNYIECTIPTDGVYPVATANDKGLISDPLMSRFCVIDIPDYSDREKREIFKRFSLPKILKRMGMREEECIVGEDALDVILSACQGETGVRDLEQAAEHLAANALYQIETKGVTGVVFDGPTTEKLLKM